MSTANILVGLKNNWYNGASDIKLQGHITWVATWKWNILLILTLVFKSYSIVLWNGAKSYKMWNEYGLN